MTLASDDRDLAEYRERARDWLASNMPRVTDPDYHVEQFLSDGQRAKELQHRLFEGGFAGICYPREYGGQGLPHEYQRVFTEESLAYEMPLIFNSPTLAITGPTLLDYGTEEQKRTYIPRMLSGEHLWVQMLTEPRGGSDLAGVVTRAERDGDSFVLTGSKIWTTAGYRADYGLCLARTNWDATKHRGMTMFLLKIDQPAVEMHRIRMVDGSMEECQEFFNEVELPVENVLGEIDQGWSLVQTILHHEHNAISQGASPYFSGAHILHQWEVDEFDLVDFVRRMGVEQDARPRELVAEQFANHVVGQHLAARLAWGMESGAFGPDASAIARLYEGLQGVRKEQITVELAGNTMLAWPREDPATEMYASNWLMRQAHCLGGGSTEMQMNMIAERVLGMPREFAADRDVPFTAVPR